MDIGKRVTPAQNKSSPGRKHPGTVGHYGRVGEVGRSALTRSKNSGTRGKDASPYPSSASAHPAQLFQLAAESPLPDLTKWIRALNFPASCNFVLKLLERYVKADVFSDSTIKASSLPSKDNLFTLVDTFVLHTPPASRTAPPSSGDKPPKGDTLTPFVLNPIEEVKLLLSLKTFLEELESVQLRFALFEALFGRSKETGKLVATLGTDEDTLGRLISLALSLGSTAILCCVGLWMQLHPTEALGLTSALYYDFCVLLPNAMAPLLELVTVSPHMAHQMSIAFTSLYPLHIVGTAAPGVDPAHLNPPIRLLEILTHWMETGPEFLFPPQLLDKQPEQLSLHSQRTKPSPSPSLLAGLIQWCVLAPLVPKTKAERKTEMENNCAKEELTTSLDFDSLMAKLHADLLSVVLSHSKSFRPHSLTSDSVAVIVAALLGFNQQRCVREGSAGMGVRMNEAVERLSQFLQISLSTGILVLKPDDLASMASTLPENRLLRLVIAHQRQ